MSPIRKALAVTAASIAVAGILTVAGPTTSASADTPCTLSQYVYDIQVTPYDGGNVKISITPSDELRDPVHAFDRDITVDMWHSVQSCVPNLYGTVADSIWQQLQCHQELAVVPNGDLDGYATGPTFDLETWHPALVNPGLNTYVGTHCLNELGTQPAGPTGDEFRPGEGYLDLVPIA